MRGSVAEMWHAANDEGKLAILQRALETCTPVDVTLLDEDIQTLDRLAQQVGLVAVYVATVDPGGLGCQSPTVVSPAIAGQYRQRAFRAGGAPRMA